MFKMGNQERDTMNSQMGYVTAKVEALDQFIRDHMKTEEDKFSSINQTIVKQQRYLWAMTLLVLLDSAGMPLDKLMTLVLKLIP